MGYTVITGSAAEEIENGLKHIKFLEADLLLWPEIEDGKPLASRQIVKRVKDFIDMHPNAVVATLSETAVLIFVNLVNNGGIRTDEVTIYDGTVPAELDVRGDFIRPHFSFFPDWEANFHLRFSDVFEINARTEEALLARGAEKCKKEDREGKTRSGFWMDGVFLGTNLNQAWRSLLG